MTYVHVNPGMNNWDAEIPNMLRTVSFVLADILGRASVPALSLISGYLAVFSIQKGMPYLKLVKNKAATFITPLFVWNMLITLFGLLIFLITSKPTSQVRQLMEANLNIISVLDFFFAINYGSLTEPLNFLRDVFVCFILLPVLYFLTTRTKLFFVMFVWFFGIVIGFEPIVVRPTILLFFILGVYIQVTRQQDSELLKEATKLILSLTLIISIASLLVPAKTIYELILRLGCSVAFLLTALFIQGTALGSKLSSLRKYCFPFYLSHSFTMTILWGGWQLVYGASQNNPYMLFYLAAPILSFGLLVVTYKFLQILPPFVGKILWGHNR